MKPRSFVPLPGLFSDSDNESSLSLGDSSPFLSDATSLGDSLSVLTEYGLKYDECFDGLDGIAASATGNNGTNVSHPINITKVSLCFSLLTFKGNNVLPSL